MNQVSGALQSYLNWFKKQRLTSFSRIRLANKRYCDEKTEKQMI